MCADEVFQEQQTRKNLFLLKNKLFFKCCYTKYLNFCVLWEDKQEIGELFVERHEDLCEIMETTFEGGLNKVDEIKLKNFE